jgi:hypothetical protein
VYSTIDKKMKRSARTIIADATIKNQPPNSRQNSDPGMWRFAANFTLSAIPVIAECGAMVSLL